MSFLLKDYDFELPENLIAQYPSEKRGDSRLMVVDRKSGDFFITDFKNINQFLPNKSFLVINNTKVIKSRIFAHKKTGGKIEIFFLEKVDNQRFVAMTKGRIKNGDTLTISDKVYFKIIEDLPENLKLIEISGSDIYTAMEKYGHIPLPPYIRRGDDLIDTIRYQTIYAKDPGSVAAPTAGLHFNESILQEIKKQHEIIEITLNVGIGTFKPIKTENILEHKMHSEKFYISEESFHKINNLKEKGDKLISVGTTTTRALESIAANNRLINYGYGKTDIFIKPGYSFQIIDHLITNFHLPKSTLFVLVSTFGGLDLMKKAYSYAIENKMRFFSYGDAMLIL